MDDLYKSQESQTFVAPHLDLPWQQDTLLGYLSTLSSHGTGGGGWASEYGNSNGVYPHSPFFQNPENKRENRRNSKRNLYKSPKLAFFSCFCTKFLDIGYKKTREKGQGSEAEMASLKRVKEEPVRGLGMLLMIYENQRRTTYSTRKKDWEVIVLWRLVYIYKYIYIGVDGSA